MTARQVWGRSVYDAAGRCVGEIARLGMRKGEVRRVVICGRGTVHTYRADQIQLDGNRVILLKGG